MTTSTFVYVTYIRAPLEKVWLALTNTDFTRKYWFGAALESDWAPGSAWRIAFPDGRITDSGEVLEIDPLKRLVLKWRNEWRPESKAEGYSTCTFEVEAAGAAVKLTVTHAIDVPNSKLIDGVSGGWPLILSNLKSLLETGELALPTKM